MAGLPPEEDKSIDYDLEDSTDYEYLASSEAEELEFVEVSPKPAQVDGRRSESESGSSNDSDAGDDAVAGEVCGSEDEEPELLEKVSASEDEEPEILEKGEEYSDEEFVKLPYQTANDESEVKQHNILERGLKLHVKQKTFAYSCALLTDKQGPISVEPLYPLIGQKHVRIHKVQMGEDLRELLAEFKWSHASSVVFINTSDGYELFNEFTGEVTDLPIPVAVVSSGDGEAILKFMRDESCPKIRIRSGSWMDDPQIIRNGIELKYEYQIEISKSYDYAPFPTTPQCDNMEWHPLVSAQNIIVLNLQELQKELPLKLNTKAVVFINENNSYYSTYQSATRHIGVSPVVLLTRRDGESIFRHLNQEHTMSIGISIDEEERIPQDYSHFVKDLAKMVQSKADISTFRNVMSAFNDYERNGRKLSGIGSKVIRKFKDKFKRKKYTELSFYILLAYRFHIKKQLYGKDVTDFVTTVLFYLEQILEPDDVAQSISSFVRRGNFSVMLGGEVNVFKLMDKACTTLAQVSHSVQGMSNSRSGQQRLYKNFLYSRMLWITIGLKFRQNYSRNLDEYKPVELWKDILDCRDQIVFNIDVFRELDKGFKLWQVIQLSPELSLDSRCFEELFAKVRPFGQLAKYLRSVHRFLSTSDQVVAMLSSISKKYFAHLAEPGTAKFDSLSKQHDLRGCLDEGIVFLDVMISILSFRKIKGNLVCYHVVPWLQELLNLIDIQNADSEEHFKLFFDSLSGTVIEAKVRNHVYDVTKSSLHKLEVKKFLKLYKTFSDIFPNSMLQEFLERSAIQADVSLLCWEDFFTEVVLNFETAQHHSFLLNFLEGVANAYERSDRPDEYIYDLMKLNVSNLLSGRSEEDGKVRKVFRDWLHDFVARQKQLVNLSHIMILASTENDHFQLLIVNVLCDEVGSSVTLRNNFLLKESVDFLKNHLELRTYASCKHRLCWRILTTICSIVVPSNYENMEWTRHYSTYLGKVFLKYCSEEQLHGDQCILTESFVNGMKSAPGDIYRYFKWVKEIQDALYVLSVKFRSQDVKYDEIAKSYLNDYTDFLKVGANVNASSLLPTDDYAKQLLAEFSSKYLSLNVHLLLFIPDHPEMKWCSLIELLRGYGVSFKSIDMERINNTVRFPNSTPDKRFVTRQLVGPFKHGQDISLSLHVDCTLRQLTEIVEDIDEFKHPLHDRLVKMLVFFNLNESFLFDVHLRLMVEKHFEDANEMSNFAAALNDTYGFFDRIVKGDVSYCEISENDVTQLEKLDIAREFTILSDYLKIYSSALHPGGGLKTVQKRLELLQYCTVLSSIHSACQKYDLKKCFEDPTPEDSACQKYDLKDFFKDPTLEDSAWQKYDLKDFFKDPTLVELSTIVAEIIGNWSTIAHEKVVENIKKVKKIFYLKDSESAKDLNVFKAVIDIDDLLQFLKEKQFCDQQGKDIFFKQFRLITAQLQHEEYNEQVLSHLFAAFQIISPFMDTDINFKELMRELKDLDVVNACNYFDTVKTNIALIRLWFSRAEGDTVEHISKELECIITTGKYTFSKKETGLVMHLEYQLGTLVPATSSDNKRSECIECWNLEQIGDFVRKLGFLDKDEEKDDIKNFLRLNQTVHKIFNLYVKLGEQGHPNYMYSVTLPAIPCNTPETVDNLLQDTQQADAMWSHRINELRDEYMWLVFFSIPRVLQLANVLRKEKLIVIVNEVSFLTTNQPWVRKKLQQKIKQTLELVINSDDDPHMVHVGKFLNHLLEGHTLPDLAKDLSSIPCYPDSVTSYFAQPLYSCSNWSQMDLQCLILRIFQGSPLSYQILYCQATTTEEELKLFLKRIEKHCSQYIMLNINKLPLKLQEHLVQEHLAMQTSYQELDRSRENVSTIHYVESGPSVLNDMPGIEPLSDLKNFTFSPDEAAQICKQVHFGFKNFRCFEVVYGSAGIGKSHYIRQQLSDCNEVLTIAVNEVFSPLYAINKLRSLSLHKENVGLFFNFTIFPPKDSTHVCEKSRYEDIMSTIGWFFFNLFVLGYVEDQRSGLSFRLPGGMQWSIYVEVPYRYGFDDNIQEVLNHFFLEIPTSKLLGTPRYIDATVPYCVDSDVQLVCKYLRAYKLRENLITGIDRMYEDTGKLAGKLVRFSRDDDLPDKECYDLLHEFMPKHVIQSKITQHLFIKYMKQRCDFLDNLPFFNYNQGEGHEGPGPRTNTKRLGSSLMQTMLNEVSDFCDPNSKENWMDKTHQQLIYDFKGNTETLGFISRRPDELQEELSARLQEIGVEIPQITDLYNRNFLDKYISRALNVELEDGKITLFDKSEYVLTLDYAIKMLNIHERFKCGVPVIIEGETGVGKTALVEMLSKLWNQSLMSQWKKDKDEAIQSLHDWVKDRYSDIPEMCLQALMAAHSDEDKINPYEDEVNLQYLLLLCNYNGGLLCSKINKKYLSTLRNNPVLALLSFKNRPIEKFFTDAENDSQENTAYLLKAILFAESNSTFHKINIHAALTPMDLKRLMNPAMEQAQKLQQAFSSCKAAPVVTVFLDEVNTSSCLGFIKELIVDRSFHGESIPKNIFIVAACNPHRGNSITFVQTWVRGTYYVHPLHPTLQLLKWDYGALDENQEKDYIRAKMDIVVRTAGKAVADNFTATTNDGKIEEVAMDEVEVELLVNLIMGSQSKMRDFAYKQMKEHSESSDFQSLAEKSSRSCVSQRDIQRVFTFYKWLSKMYLKYKPHGDRKDYQRRAVLVALGLIYYVRLDANFRSEYTKFLDHNFCSPSELSFTQAFNDEIDYYIQQIELPEGIAPTIALKENIFATILCTMTHTPLIIVGAPGSSKTLSFNLTVANFKGQKSNKLLFRDAKLFCSLDPHYYQCSRRTTSNEIKTVFAHAIYRQNSHKQFNILSVVFMDEAGLPEESHESLKVLHPYLDKQEVSFVAITNHILDAAKTNRAVSLYRPEASNEDLEALVKAYLSHEPAIFAEVDVQTVIKMCQPYSDYMKSPDFSSFFGLRDFMQFVSYIQRSCDENEAISPQLVLQALERNFNGTDEFDDICEKFFKAIGASFTSIQQHRRQTIDILLESLKEKPLAKKENKYTENEVRYKLVIDPSEDVSLIRAMFSVHAMDRRNTHLFVCSDFPEDSEVQKINTIAAIRHSATKGHTIVLTQADDILESFYDLFNHRFLRIDDPQTGPRFYANIAIGAHHQPSIVDPNFQCVVVIKKSEIKFTPAPFLNRFEKYVISYHSLLNSVLHKLPPRIRSVIYAAQEKVKQFIQVAGGSKSFYGLQQHDTLYSLLLELLPPVDYTYTKLENDKKSSQSGEDIATYLFQQILGALRSNAKFHIPRYPMEELQEDAANISRIIRVDAKLNVDDLFNSLTHENVKEAVTEAFNFLYSLPGQGEGDEMFIKPESCMVIIFIQQMLVLFLTKRLMQLMTTEAIIIHHKQFPPFYLEQYLGSQAHFSLKETITTYNGALTKTKKDITRSPSKLVCFTRSSTLLHTLPAQYPFSEVDVVMTDPEKISSIVFEQADKLVLRKLSNLPSHDSLQELLENFLCSDKAEVCLLLANMEETSYKTINHVKIMIEEEELKICDQRYKLFVLLLHIPPSKFFKPSYPAIFLKGWDYTYLDTIAHGYDARKGILDIQDWFCKCCFSEEQQNPSSSLSREASLSHGSVGLFSLACSSKQSIMSGPPDTLSETLCHLLPQIILPLSAGGYFGSKSDNSFNSSMDVTQRCTALDKLLRDRQLGARLCEMFRAYWTPKVMMEYLADAAKFSIQRESTLNITDSMQTKFKSLFTYFCIYMLIQANEDFNLDILYDSEENNELFLNLFCELPVPSLSMLSFQSSSLSNCQTSLCQLQFPFFKRIYTLIEELVESSQETASFKLHELPNSHLNGTENFNEKLQSLVEILVDNLAKSKQKDNFLCLVLDSMASGIELWHCYFKDFVNYKISLVSLDHEDATRTEFAYNILSTHFKYLDEFDATHRMAELHITYQLQVAKMVTILRPLSKCKQVQPTRSMPEEQMSLSLLSQFLIQTLFESMMSAMDQPIQDLSSSPHPMEEWFWAYRDVMNLSSLKLSIYSFLCMPEEYAGHTSALIEAMDLMHTTFVTILFGPSGPIDVSTLQKAQRVVEALWKSPLSQHPLDVGRSGLEAAVNILVKINDLSPMQLQKMLDHFFSSLRPSYSSDDILWFLKLANNQLELCHKINIETSVLRFYLGRVLSSHADAEQVDVVGPLQYNRHLKELVEEVLTLDVNLGDSGPYIPKFHQMSKINSRMQQPLCHLYFSTYLDHLQSTFQGRKHSELATFIKAARSMQSILLAENGREHVVLWLEFQAVIELLIKELASHFEWSKLSDVLPHKESINSLHINDENHGRVFAMHLLNHLKSFQASSKIVSSNDELLDSISCIAPINQLFEGSQRSRMKPLQLPFLWKGNLSDKYKKVENILNEIHKGSRNVSDLISIARTFTESGASEWTSLSRSKNTYNSYGAFRMLLWLAVYYSFYLQGVESSELCEIMESEELSKYLTKREYVVLLQCFLQPSRMCRCKIHEVDSIYQLFMPTNPGQQSSSDIDLRDSLAHLVAVVLGSPPHSNHLWYHMFAPDGLHNTFMTGFMYDDMVCHDGKMYNDGVELSPAGLYGRQGYRAHAYEYEGNSTLHSQYLLLWCNFGCFCVSLLTQPDSEQHIHGSIISESLQLRHYCMKHLRALWQHIRNNLGLIEEFRALFIRNALDRFFKFFNEQDSNASPSPSVIGSFGGKFTDRSCLHVYETWWHDCIYQPAWRYVTKIQLNEPPQGDLLKRIKLFRDWANFYPRYPSEEDLIHYTQDSEIFQQHRVLAMFAMDYQQLYWGGVLLPDLIRFYQWLHTSLAYSLTHEVATYAEIGEVVERAEKEHGEHIRKLYDRVKQNFNRYIEVTGGDIVADSRTIVRVESISNVTRLVNFLTDSENAKGSCLFLVLADIIHKHNQTIKNFYTLVQPKGHVDIVPPQPYKILLTEVDSESVIIDSLKEQHGTSMYLQLIRRRYQMRTRCFDLDELEEDILLYFIAGKPIILDPLKFRENFKFRKLTFSILDLEDTSQLRGTFDTDLPSGILKNEFHSASYHLLLEVLTALQTVVRHLIKALKESTTMDLKRMNILAFMRKVYELHDCDHVFYNLGIQSAPSKTQVQCLATIPLTSAYSCFKFFFQWIDDGYYDFNDLPIIVKKSINPKDIETPIEEIDSQWDDSPAVLLKALQQLVDVLKDSEQDIKCATEISPDQPFVDYLMEKYNDMDLECKHLVKNNFISKSIALHHYVEFRISIRRLCLKVQHEVDRCRDTKQILKWQEVVEDLWNVHFPCLKKELLGVGKYPFMEINGSSGAEEEMDKQEDSKKLESVASTYQVDDVANFLTEMGLPAYSEEFRKHEISGDMLLKADSEMLIDLGVTSPRHQLMITQHFLQKLKGISGIDDSSADDMTVFLTKIGLSQYTEVFMVNNIGVNMLMKANPALLKPEFLVQLEITSPLHQMKILHLIQREVRGTPARYTAECFSKFLKENSLAKYEAVLEENGIDGDMILDAENELIVSALKKVGVSGIDARKIRDKSRTYISRK